MLPSRTRLVCLGLSLLFASSKCPTGSAEPAQTVQVAAETLTNEELAKLPGGPVERFELADGTVVLLQVVEGLPCTSVTLRVPIGAIHDPPGRAGLTQVLAQLQSRSPLGHPQGSLLLQLESIGAKTSYRVLPECTIFSETVPSQHLEWMLGVATARLKLNKWAGNEVQHQLRIVTESWARQHTQPARFQRQKLLAALYGLLSPDISQTSPMELEQFCLQNWNFGSARPAATLTVVGGFSAQEVRKLLSKLNSNGKNQPGEVRSAGSHTFGAALQQPQGTSVEWMFRLPVNPKELAALTVIDASFRGRPGWETALSFEENSYTVKIDLQGRSVLSAESEFSEALQSAPFRLANPVALKTCQSLALRRFYRHFDDCQSRSAQLACNEGIGQLGRLASYPGYIRGLTSSELSALAPNIFDTTKATKIAPADSPNAAGVTIAAPAETNEASGNKRVSSEGPNYRAKPASTHPFTRLELDKGITILVQPVRDLPTVTIRGFVSGGNALDTAALAGRSELLTATLEQRIQAHPLWPDSGLDLKLSCASNYISIDGWAPKDALEDWFEVLVTALSPQAVNAAEMNRSRNELSARWQNDTRDLETVAYRRWLSSLFSPDHPLGRSSADCLNSLPNLSMDTINQHWAKICRPNRLVLTFSGDISMADITQKLGPKIGRLAAPDESPSNVELSLARNQENPQRQKMTWRRSDSALILTGTLAPSRKDPDYYAFSLLSQILGGNSVSGRLPLRLKNRDGLASSIQSRFLSGMGPQPMLISARVSPQSVEQSLKAIEEEVERLRTSQVSRAELEQAVANLEGQLQVSQGSSFGRAAILRNIELFHLSDDYTNGFAGLYRNLSPKDIQEVAKRRLNPKNFSILTVEPE